jgi:tetratricopeptide (TPR) repeat protein
VFLHTLEESGSKHGRLPAPLLNDIGYVYLLRFGEADMAVPYLREAIESDPDHINGWINLVFALVVLGRLAETQETLRAARGEVPRRSLAGDPPTAVARGGRVAHQHPSVRYVSVRVFRRKWLRYLCRMRDDIQ